MAIASLTAWLNDPNRSYLHGKLLYEQYGENRVLLTLFQSGSTSYHFSKLQDALEELNKKSNLEPKQIVIGDYILETLPSPGNLPVDFKDAPEKIIEIRNNKNKRYAQARRLFESIRVLDSQEHRLQAGLELLDHMDFVNESWEAIDEWKENGRIREIQEKQSITAVENLSVADLLKEAKNLPTYITKDKQKLAEATTATKQAKIATRLQVREHRLKLIKKRLEDK